MKYTEVIIQTTQNGIDECCDKLNALGLCEYVIENESDFRDFLENNRQYWDYVDKELEEQYSGVSRIKLYLEDTEDGAAALTAIKDAGFEIKVNIVDDSDWENNWKQYYKPLEIGSRLIVVPEWEQTDTAGRVPLRLDPGLMFGTGSHATTRMCLEALQDYAPDGKRILDLGCGSGILGIGALVLGAQSCLACDIDPKAPDVVMDNAALNGIDADRLTVYAGDIIGDASLRKTLGTGFDIVLANIVSDVIIPLAPFVRGFMAQGAVFITSGIIDGRDAEVAAALKAAGFAIEKHLHEEEWHCFVCR